MTNTFDQFFELALGQKVVQRGGRAGGVVSGRKLLQTAAGVTTSYVVDFPAGSDVFPADEPEPEEG